MCGTTHAAALAARDLTDACVTAAVAQADVFILTLGLIECWRNRRSGHFVWGAGVGRKSVLADDLVFHLASYEENLANLRRICELVFQNYPEKRIILSVSPVSLVKTFTGQDVVVANSESKSQLRAVAGQICREFPQAHYWPSYEIASKQDMYGADGRHVTPEGVSFIIDNFLRVHAPRRAA